MAFAFTVTQKVPYKAGYWEVMGTFTSAAGDNSGSLANSTHGLNNIVKSNVDFNSAALNAANPKVTVSGGTVTITCDNSDGLSGNWNVVGN